MSDSKRRREAEAAIDLTLTALVKIKCDHCGNRDSVQTPTCDAVEAATAFYDSGWRVVGNAVLCKKCRRRK